jgi:3-oxoacyl-[acyl-carrier protein] reductase
MLMNQKVGTAPRDRDQGRVGGAARNVALVTGGSRGLGAELVSGFLARQYAVATLSRTKTAFIEQILRSPRKGNFCRSAVDACDNEALRRYVTRIADRFGRIDVLVNNLGTAVDGVLPTMRTQDISEAVQVNLTAALVLSQACSRVMLRQGRGSIINISSVNAIRGHTGVAVYSATKAGLDGLTRSLARELGPRSIRVNSVAPGYFESEMARGLTEEQMQRIVRRTPLGRLASAQDIANAVYFLVSEQASFITGQILLVDGGITC